MKIYSQFGLVTLLAALVAALLEFGGGPKPVGILRVGINPTPGAELIFLAEEKGFYRAEGVEVRLVEFTCLSDCRRAYERGLVDVVGSAAVQLPAEGEESRLAPQITPIRDHAESAETPSGLAGGRPADVEKFLRALHRAAAYTRKNREDAGRIIAGPPQPAPEPATKAATLRVETPAPSERKPVAQPGDRLITFIEPAPKPAGAAAISVAFWQR
ncbi:MAG: hypothetical protein K8R23_06215 [Chthoniobacter sp.]|nr:hypothetical protein [Chthoniobacter sp.]